MKTEYKKAKVNDKFVGMIPLEFADSKKSETVDIPDKIHMIPIGEWMHDMYGPMIINNADIREFAQNFNAGIRKGVFITAGHEGFEELPAVAWVKEVEVMDDGLWGIVEWNKNGLEALADKQWKFFSPELCRDYEDPETHALYRNVLTGGALTKSPYFKELQAIVFSDKNIKSNLDKQSMSKTLEEVLALEVSALTDEDKAVLKENAESLTDEQKVAYADVIKEEAPAETDEEKAAREEKEKGDANEAAGLNRDGSPKESPVGGDQAMSEKNGMVTMTKAMFSALEAKANQGAEAFAQLETKELNEMVTGMTFSSTNKKGAFLPKSKDIVTTFMKSLNKDQRKAFSEVIATIPTNHLFTEKGENNNIEGTTAFAEVESAVNAKMKENTNLKYADALKEVFSTNPALETRYNKELEGSK